MIYIRQKNSGKTHDCQDCNYAKHVSYFTRTENNPAGCFCNLISSWFPSWTWHLFLGYRFPCIVPINGSNKWPNRVGQIWKLELVETGYDTSRKRLTLYRFPSCHKSEIVSPYASNVKSQKKESDQREKDGKKKYTLEGMLLGTLDTHYRFLQVSTGLLRVRKTQCFLFETHSFQNPYGFCLA